LQEGRANYGASSAEPVHQIDQFAEMEEPPIAWPFDRLLGMLERPGQIMRHVAARLPASSAGTTSDLSELPTIMLRSAPSAWRATIHSQVAGVLSLTISTASNSSPRPDGASLRSWSNRSPLVTRMIR
jgi:hypothetical protein